ILAGERNSGPKSPPLHRIGHLDHAAARGLLQADTRSFLGITPSRGDISSGLVGPLSYAYEAQETEFEWAERNEKRCFAVCQNAVRVPRGEEDRTDLRNIREALL
ncbi:hypothetical protein BaRGS_00037382, partial [Batillaria attramentaria]